MSDDEAPPSADPPSPSLASSAPPEPQGHQVGAQQLSNHPVWMSARGDGNRAPASRGRSGGRGRGRSGPGSEAGDLVNAPRYERISIAELEARQYADGDGADSAIQSDDEARDDHWDRVRPAASSGHRKKRKKGPREEGDEPEDSDDDDSDDGDDRRRKLAGLMGAAAFGGAGHYARGAASEAGSMPSENSSARRRDAYKDAFPVRDGLRRVRAGQPHRPGQPIRARQHLADDRGCPVEDGGLCYKREVAEPTEREGAPPSVELEAGSAHYELRLGQLCRQTQDDSPAAGHAPAAGAAPGQSGQWRKGADRQEQTMLKVLCHWHPCRCVPSF